MARLVPTSAMRGANQRGNVRIPSTMRTGGATLLGSEVSYTLVPSVGEEGEVLTTHEMPGTRNQAVICDEGVGSANDWRSMMKNALDSVQVQCISASVIIANAAVIGLETDYPHIINWSIIEDSFFIFFFLELVTRVITMGPLAYIGCTDDESAKLEVTWNLFDLGIVSIGLFDFVSQIVSNPTSGSNFATILRMVRLLRILRIFKIIRFLKQLYLLAYGFVEAAIAVFWVTILMGFVLYVCAIVLTRNYAGLPVSDPHHLFFANKFGSIPQSMLTLFELMSQPDLSAYHDSHQSVLASHCELVPFLVAFIIFGSFGMIALLTGVISESMFEKNQARIEEERQEQNQRREKLRTECDVVFRNIDSEGHGCVSQKQLKENTEIIKQLIFEFGSAIDDSDIEKVFEALDLDASGQVDMSEFERGIFQLSGEVKQQSVMELQNGISKCNLEIESCNKALRVMNADVHDQLSNLALMVNSVLSELTNKPIRKDTCEADACEADACEADACRVSTSAELEARAVQQQEPAAAAPCSFEDYAEHLLAAAVPLEAQTMCRQKSPEKYYVVPEAALLAGVDQSAESIKKVPRLDSINTTASTFHCGPQSPLLCPRTWPPTHRPHESDEDKKGGFASERLQVREVILKGEIFNTCLQNEAQQLEKQDPPLTPNAAQSKSVKSHVDLSSSQTKSCDPTPLSSSDSADLEFCVRTVHAQAMLVVKLKNLVDDLTDQWHADLSQSKGTSKSLQEGLDKHRTLHSKLESYEPMLQHMRVALNEAVPDGAVQPVHVCLVNEKEAGNVSQIV